MYVKDYSSFIVVEKAKMTNERSTSGKLGRFIFWRNCPFSNKKFMNCSYSRFAGCAMRELFFLFNWKFSFDFCNYFSFFISNWKRSLLFINFFFQVSSYNHEALNIFTRTRLIFNSCISCSGSVLKKNLDSILSKLKTELKDEVLESISELRKTVINSLSHEVWIIFTRYVF